MIRARFPGLALGFAVLLSAMSAQAAPPPEQTVSQWSDDERKIAAESGARITGDWVTARAPYARRPMDCCGVNHPAPKVWMRWAAKTSKSQVLLNASFHAIATAPRSIMALCPSLGKAQDFERELFTPNANASPAVASRILATRSRSGDGSTTRYKRFRGGFLKIATASSEKELQQSDVGLVIFEEPSSYPADVGGRGSPIRQARARTFAWGDDAKEIGGGTPNLVGDCVVSDEVEAGTLERYYLPCPHCGAWQLLLWENMHRSAGRPVFTCLGCGADIGHEHKAGMLAASIGVHPELDAWVPCFASENPENPAPPPCIGTVEELHRWQARDTEGRNPSFDGIWQAYSPFATWARIMAEYDEAKSSPEKLVTFHQQVLGRPFEAAYERPQADALYAIRDAAAALAQVQRGYVPPWAWALVGAADVQGYGIKWAVYAVGPGPLDAEGRPQAKRRARIDHGLIPIPPVDPKAWAELSRVVSQTYEGPHCRKLAIDRFGVDTGGHHTMQAYAWCAGRPNVLALKGKPNDREALPLTAGRRAKAKVNGRVVASVQLYLVGTHKVKKEVYFGLAQTRLGVETGAHLPASLTFDPHATEQDFKELTAEVLLPKDPAKRRKEEEWVRSPVGAPNEELDLAVYGWALDWALLPDRMTATDWEAWIAPRRRDPARDGALPLETIWASLPPLAEDSGEGAGTGQPRAAANAVPAQTPPSGGIGGAGPANPQAASAAAPAPPSTSSAAAILALATRNRNRA